MTNPLSSLPHGVSDELTLRRATPRQFVDTELAPRAAAVDRDTEFPHHLGQKMGDLGLLGITVDERHGGSGMGYLAHIIVLEEISRRQPPLDCPMVRTPTFASIKSSEMDRKVKREIPTGSLLWQKVGALAMSEPNAGSDVVSMKLRADLNGDHYVLNGNKCGSPTGLTRIPT